MHILPVSVTRCLQKFTLHNSRQTAIRLIMISPDQKVKQVPSFATTYIIFQDSTIFFLFRCNAFFWRFCFPAFAFYWNYNLTSKPEIASSCFSWKLKSALLNIYQFIYDKRMMIVYFMCFFFLAHRVADVHIQAYKLYNVVGPCMNAKLSIGDLLYVGSLFIN